MNINELNRNLHRLVFSMDKQAETILRQRLDLTFSQFRMLLAVQKGHIACQADVAEFFGLTPAAVSRQIDILIQKKLINRKANTMNRRQKVLQLTAAGNHIAKKAIHLLEAAFTGAYDLLSQDERKIFSESLDKLTKNICSLALEHL